MNLSLKNGLGYILIFVLISACLSQAPEITLPDSISGLPLTRVISGEEAEKIIERMHDKSIAPDLNQIGFYTGNSRQAILYVSSFGSARKANKRLKEMSDEIGTAGSSGFGHQVQFRVNDHPIHLVVGYGQVHFFYAQGNYLYWLTIDADMARAALAQVLDVEPQAVPSLNEIFEKSMSGR